MGDPKRIRINVAPSSDIVMPSVLESGKDATWDGDRGQGFDPDWCIIRISDGVPKKKKSIFVHSGKFPVANRPGKILQTRTDLKKYFSSVGKGGPSWSRFADFHLLLYLARELDVDTVYQICDSVRTRNDVLPGIVEMVNALCT